MTANRISIATPANFATLIKSCLIDVSVDNDQYEQLEELSEETGISIQDLVYDFIDWGLEVKADSLRKAAQRAQKA